MSNDIDFRFTVEVFLSIFNEELHDKQKRTRCGNEISVYSEHVASCVFLGPKRRVKILRSRKEVSCTVRVTLLVASHPLPVVYSPPGACAVCQPTKSLCRKPRLSLGYHYQQKKQLA